jgi:hypothetical protein
MAKQRPVWAISGLPEGVTVRRVDLQPRVPNERSFGGETMLFNGKAIGKSEQPLYDAARWLLANNAAAEGDAAEGDTIAIYRGETLSMHGIVGDLAKWTVVESKQGDPSLRLRRYVPFSGCPVASRTGEMAMAATQVAAASNGDEKWRYLKTA